MKTEWKDVAHLYLGCEIMLNQFGKIIGPFRLHGIDNIGVITNLNGTGRSHADLELIKPILRPIHTMTQDEMIEWASMNGYDLTKEEKTIEEVHKSLTKGLKEKGLNYLKVNESEFELVPKFLLFALKHHFDLFSLIPNGQAIDRTTLPSLTNQ